MKTNKLFWGLAFIVAAIILIIEAIGEKILIFGISSGRILLGALLVYLLIDGIVGKKLINILFSIAFLFMVFEPYIARLVKYPSDNIISNWLVLLCTLLIYTGIKIIFSSGKKNTSDKEHRQNFAGVTTKYIDCADFKEACVVNKLAQTNVFFDNIDRYEGGATLRVENKMGLTVIHLPVSWYIVCDISNHMGRVDLPSCGNPEGKVLNITGFSRIGDVRIVFDEDNIGTIQE